MTTKKKIKVKPLLKEMTLLAPTTYDLRDIYTGTKEAWVEDTNLLAIPFPWDAEIDTGELIQTETDDHVSFNFETTHRVKLKKGWKIRRYVDKE